MDPFSAYFPGASSLSWPIAHVVFLPVFHGQLICILHARGSLGRRRLAKHWAYHPTDASELEEIQVMMEMWM